MRPQLMPPDPKAKDFPSIMQQVLHAVNVAPALRTMLPDHVNIVSINAYIKLKAFFVAKYPSQDNRRSSYAMGLV